MLLELNRISRQTFNTESKAMLHLAIPMIIAQLAQIATGFVDTVMSGHVSTNDLAAVSIGSSFFATVCFTLMGVMTALSPMLSQQVGAKDYLRLVGTTRQGLGFGLLLGLFGSFLLIECEWVARHLLTLDPVVLDKTVMFLVGASIGLPPAMMHRALHAYASSQNKAKPIMIVSLLALALNIPLNYILIHGLFGLPKLGGAGCGWATGLVFWFNFLALFAYVSWHKHFQHARLGKGFSLPDWKLYGAFLKLGIPIALSFFVEVSLFSAIALLVADLGTTVVASHQAALNFVTMIYMVPQSLSTALSVKVGQYVGAKDYRQARVSIGIGMCTGLLFSVLTTVGILLLRHDIIRLYTSDIQVITLGGTLLLFGAINQLTDATQTLASAALRGYKLTRIPMAIHITAFWGIGLGLGVILGRTNWLTSQPMGVYGFWLALSISLIGAAVFLVSYVEIASKQFMKINHPAQPNRGEA